MTDLYIDIETYCSISLADAGAFKYASSPDFEILLFSYAVDGGAVRTVDMACGEELPADIVAALTDPAVRKHAYNAAFEWICIGVAFNADLSVDQWRDSMLHATYCGYPASLEAAGAALGLGADRQKLSIGKSLIRYFCMPCAPTKANGMRTRNLPKHDPEKWRLFKEYNARDVEAEMAIDAALSAFPVPDTVQRQWETDLRINARGVAVDLGFVNGAIDIRDRHIARLEAQARAITGLDNLNSLPQLKGWIAARLPQYVVKSLDKAALQALISAAEDEDDDVAVEALKLRQELSKTSCAKYDAITRCVCPDGRVRGLLQFYGANRTGRWAGRLVQVQNLPRTYVEPLDEARELVAAHDLEAFAAIFGNVQDNLSQLIRTALVATPGHRFVDCDFSAIEARIIAWLADEEWKLDVFRSHGKIYEASASQMFGVPIERIVKGNPEYALRQRGKVAELALGYGGGVNAMRAMDTGHQLDDLDDDAVQDIVNRWRAANSNIVRLWRRFENAAKTVIEHGGARRIPISDAENPAVSVLFKRESDPVQTYLTITLPSGRQLFYVHPRIGRNRFGSDSIIYDGVDQQTRQFTGLETYGGKLVENVVQAIARDCLALAIERLEWCRWPVVFHVHDEIVVDLPYEKLGGYTVQQMADVMCSKIAWAPGLPLNADGWVGQYYRKE